MAGPQLAAVAAALFACAVLLSFAATLTEAQKKVVPPKSHHEKCKDKAYPLCYGLQIPCPSKCPKNCYIDCQLCAPVCQCDKPGAVCYDPRFVGADGITFYFHGKKDRDFCLVSDADLHINAHFIGRRDSDRPRDYTWIQSLGVLFGDHQLYLGALKTAAWDPAVDRLTVAFDGEPVLLPQEDGSAWRSTAEPSLTITRSGDANGVVVEVDGKFRVTASVVPVTAEESRLHTYGVTEEDCFAHLEVGFRFYSLTSDVHGVLGQTYRDGYVSRVKMSANMPIMGGEPDYEVSSLFTADCKVSRFGALGGEIALVAGEPKELNCASRMGGRGIVCRR